MCYLIRVAEAHPFREMCKLAILSRKKHVRKKKVNNKIIEHPRFTMKWRYPCKKNFIRSSENIHAVSCKYELLISYGRIISDFVINLHIINHFILNQGRSTLLLRILFNYPSHFSRYGRHLSNFVIWGYFNHSHMIAHRDFTAHFTVG